MMMVKLYTGVSGETYSARVALDFVYKNIEIPISSVDGDSLMVVVTEALEVAIKELELKISDLKKMKKDLEK